MKIIITGGAGFIGSAVARYIINHTSDEILIVDCLTYAGNINSLNSISENERFHFEKVNICDVQALALIFAEFCPDAVMHLAAESHVDRSIDGPEKFIETNVTGTCRLLEVSRRYWLGLTDEKKAEFRFLHVSTDEVFGELDGEGMFTELTPYAPGNPYSASKAASDHLARAWRRTYGLPVIITNCSNNYGPYHYPEKLIPLTILNALEGQPLPVYGGGEQIRDWLYVDDHARALYQVLIKGLAGETYFIGGRNEKRNIDIVRGICRILDELVPLKSEELNHYEGLITYVADRPGHDTRYATDASLIKSHLGWEPGETFDSGLRKTVEWYLANPAWWKPLRGGTLQK